MRRPVQPPSRRVLNLLLAGLLLAAGCASGSGMQSTGQTTDRNEAVPTLAQLARTPADAGTVRFRTGADAGQDHNSTADMTGRIFHPAWAPAVGDRDPAWAIYHFNLADYTGNGEVHITWSTGLAPDPGDWYLGLSDFTAGTWEWVTGGSAAEYSIPGFADFRREDGAAFVALVILGTADCRLDWLRIGDNLAPVVELTAGTTTGPAPLATILDATGSADHDGTVTAWEWDLDGDGEYNEAGAESAVRDLATVEHTYTEAGSYHPAVRVSDDAGASAVRAVAIDVSTSAVLQSASWGGASSEVINAVQVDPGGDIYLAGYTTGFGQGQSDVLILKYSAGGELLWSRTWGAVGEDHATALAFRAPDTLYVAGMTTIPDGGNVALILEYGIDGTWRDTILWGTC